MSFGTWFTFVFILAFCVVAIWFFTAAGVAKDKNK